MDGSTDMLNTVMDGAVNKRTVIFEGYMKKLMKWLEYEEKYFFNLEDVYTVLDSDNAQNGPSDWSFSGEGTNGHDLALSQNKQVTSLEG